MITATCLAWLTYLSVWLLFTCIDVARESRLR